MYSANGNLTRWVRRGFRQNNPLCEAPLADLDSKLIFYKIYWSWGGVGGYLGLISLKLVYTFLAHEMERVLTC